MTTLYFRLCGPAALRLRALFFAAFLILLPARTAAETPEDTAALFDLSIEQLMSIEVYSVSKKDEPLAKASAAVFVLTAEDLRRSGALSVPEALRLVPGLHVAQLDNSTWSVSSRGFNGVFSNKLLVLVDGRSVYNPIFSGVYWNALDISLENIERIEVIRGPGGTLWGANAVNGVIDIITKHTAKTAGSYLAFGGGSEERAFAEARQGNVWEGGGFRAGIRAYHRDAAKLPPEIGIGDAYDETEGGSANFRLDSELSAGETLFFAGDLKRFKEDSLVRFEDSTAAAAFLPARRFGDHQEASLQGKYHRRMANGDELSLQAFYAWYERDDFTVRQEAQTYDLELQHSLQPVSGHTLSWGAGFRRVEDHFQDAAIVQSPDPRKSYDLFSGFVQDEVALRGNQLRLILGTKLEHHTFTGFEPQPNLRLIWNPDEGSSLWAAYSRAIRSPARYNDSLNIRAGSFEALPGRRLTTILLGDEQIDSEKLNAYEVGWRQRLSGELQLDLATFLFDYSDLESIRFESPRIEPPLNGSAPFLPARWVNGASAVSYGGELTLTWSPVSYWRLQGGYSALELEMEFQEGAGGIQDEGEQTVEQQLVLRSLLNLSESVEIDALLRFVDSISQPRVDDYAELDLRVGWRPYRQLELAVSGRNLLAESHREFGEPFFGPLGTLRQRAVYAVAKLRF